MPSELRIEATGGARPRETRSVCDSVREARLSPIQGEPSQPVDV